MYETILIPVDLSDSNDAVLTRAAEMGTPGETALTLVHVIETLDDIPVDDEDDDFYEELRQNAESKMAPWAERLADAGFDVTVEIAYGKRGQELVRLAEDANLVVMRSHVVDPDEETSREQVGTVSHQVALFAPCSVLLVRDV